MVKHFLLFVIVLITHTLLAQDYVDIATIDYGTILGSGYEDSDETTDVTLFNAGITYPIKMSERTAIVTGINYSQNSLSLAPQAPSVTLNTAILKLGLNMKHNEKWSGTYLFLPKIASQDFRTNGNSFFFGGLVLLKYQKTDNFQYRLGAYASSEGFGMITTPVLGLYYTSKNEKFEATVNLPINADLNYSLGDNSSFGLAFQAPVRSFSLFDENENQNAYVQVSNIEIGPYFQYKVLDQSLLLRLQAGYSTVSYEAFEEGDILPIRLSAIEFGDDRNLLNPEMTGSYFVKVGAIYRFYLNK